MTAHDSERAPLGRGAAREAPTAPHATSSPGPEPRLMRGRRRLRTGPERFWSLLRGRRGITVALVLSVALHIAPWVLSGLPAGVNVHDLDGEAVLPFDVLVESVAPSPEPPMQAEPEPSEPLPEGAGAGPTVADAGPSPAARVADAGASRASEAGASPFDAGLDGQAVAAADAAPPLEPEAVADAVQGGPAAIEIAIDAAVVRKHPVGAKMGSLLRGIPQWEDFMHGTPIDPVRDVDWILISGNSLIHTENDSVVLRYSASDATVDQAVRIVARRYGHGGTVDAGAPGVRASVAFADRAERILLQPGSHLLAIVPPRVAPAIARQLAGRQVSPPLHPGEALYWKFVRPHRMLGELPETVVEMRLRIVPRPDGGADVDVDGDTKDRDEAQAAAGDVARFIRRHDDPITSLLTRGILDHVDVTAEGSRVHAHLTATLDQIANLVALLSSFIGVDDSPGPPSPSAPPASGPGKRVPVR